MPFTFRALDLPDIVLIEPKVFEDPRGFFMETYKSSDFIAAGITAPLKQENHSRSIRGTLRGLHAQRAPKAQGKLISVLEGEIFDVALDIRRESPTFGRWTTATLSRANRYQLFIPPGYAHGFAVLSDVAEVVYKTTEEYAPELEYGVRWDDPELAIPWPLRGEPILSSRDRTWPRLRDLL